MKVIFKNIPIETMEEELGGFITDHAGHYGRPWGNSAFGFSFSLGDEAQSFSLPLLGDDEARAELKVIRKEISIDKVKNFSWTTSGGNVVTYNVEKKTCTYTGRRHAINNVLPHTADEWEFQYVETKKPTWHPLSNKDSKENWTTQERMDEQRYRESLLKPFKLTPFQRGY
jgi:hypothetical protein